MSNIQFNFFLFGITIKNTKLIGSDVSNTVITSTEEWIITLKDLKEFVSNEHSLIPSF